MGDRRPGCQRLWALASVALSRQRTPLGRFQTRTPPAPALWAGMQWEPGPTQAGPVGGNMGTVRSEQAGSPEGQ